MTTQHQVEKDTQKIVQHTKTVECIKSFWLKTYCLRLHMFDMNEAPVVVDHNIFL